MTLRKFAFLAVFASIFSPYIVAQKNEVSFSIGALHSSDQKTNLLGVSCPVGVPGCNNFSSSTSTGAAFEGVYTRQLFTFGAGSLDLELPVVGARDRDVKVSTSGVTVPASLTTSSLFFTPSARIKFLHSSPISPFISAGGGLAHFSTTVNSVLAFSTFNNPSTGKTNGAFQFGGGLDFKTPLKHLALRAEVRDFWALGIQSPSSSVRISPERQHNIFAGGGLVFRF